MSYYYSYYFCYKKDGKIYPYAPYTIKGKLKPILEKSRSFASDLYQDFNVVQKDQISEELFKEFSYEIDENDVEIPQLKFLEFNKLTTEDYIKKGYFLIEDIKEYDGLYSEDIFYNMITPEMYAIKLQNEIMFGKNTPKKDSEGYEYTEPNASDYMWYAAIQYNSKEYESWLIRNAVDMLYDYDFFKNGMEVIIVETEG